MEKRSSSGSKSKKEVKSKVRERIAENKRWDALDRSRRTSGISNGVAGLSLEDLYQVSEQELPPKAAQTELRKTLRLVKEKDLIILKLRETCHDLTLRFADAENTIDQLRFSRSGLPMRKSISVFNIAKREEDELTAREMKDQATETNMSILEESCSNWMEKVQNWKTDAALLATTCGADADSGFLGSEFDSTGRRKQTLEKVGTKTPGKLLFQGQSLESTVSSSKKQTIGTNTDQQEGQPQILPKHSQSFNDLHSFSATATTSHHSHKSESRERLYPSSHMRVDHFKTLDPLLDDATALARRVQKKSRRLAKLISQSVEKRV